jgi:hypothetical protein
MWSLLRVYPLSLFLASVGGDVELVARAKDNDALGHCDAVQGGGQVDLTYEGGFGSSEWCGNRWIVTDAAVDELDPKRSVVLAHFLRSERFSARLFGSGKCGCH